MEPIAFYQQFLSLARSKERDEWVALCPFHEEKTPSFYVNEKNGYFFCFGCGKSGGMSKFLELIGRPEKKDLLRDVVETIKSKPVEVRLVQPISNKVIEQLHQNLIDEPSKLQYLIRTRLISYFTIKKFQLGWDTSTTRYSIPIRSKNGKFSNIKLHNSDLKPKCFFWQEGATHKLFPFSSLMRNEIILCEGEFDCLALHSLGINAVTQTGGASNWNENWNQFFIGKTVKIVYDTDSAGIEGAKVLKKELQKATEKIHIVELPSSDEKEDVTTFLQKGGDIFRLLRMKRRK